jgi:hypothetical protein
MRRLAVVVLAAVAVLAVAAPALARGTVINVPSKYTGQLAKVKQKSGIAVRLPTYLDAGINPSRVFGNSSARKNHYSLDLGVSKHCGGGTACFIAAFFGDKGGHRRNGTVVQLANGITGRYEVGGCGASCAPNSIGWRQKGVLYTIQNKGTMSKLIRLANQAIKAGPR